MNISITNKDGLVLETAHEICKENIIIEPVLQDINITRNGKYLPGDGYAGIGRAFIEIPDSAIPIEVATEEEMTAILSSGNVGGVYKYVGETGEVYANGEMYVLEEDALAGTWVFNDVVIGSLARPMFNEFVNLNFTALVDGSEVTFSNMGMVTSGPYLYYNSSTSVYSNGWTNDGYKTIYISSLLSDVVPNHINSIWVTPEDFLAWLQANATKQ